VLGASCLTTRLWAGSCWLFPDVEAMPDPAKSDAMYAFEAGCALGVWIGRDRLVCATDGGAVDWLSLDAEAQFRCTNLSKDHHNTVAGMAVNADDTRLMTGGRDANLTVYNTDTALPHHRYCKAHASSLTSLAPHPRDADVFATAGTEGGVLMWDTRLPRPAHGLYRDQSNVVTALAWAGDDNILFGGLDGKVALYDARNLATLSHCQALSRPISRLAIRGERLAVCGQETKIAILRVTNGELEMRRTEEKHTDMVSDVLWLDDDTTVSCSWDGTVQTARLPSDDQSSSIVTDNQ